MKIKNLYKNKDENVHQIRQRERQRLLQKHAVIKETPSDDGKVTRKGYLEHYYKKMRER